MHVLNDRNDPFYTSLQAGEYDKVRPEGSPCDAAIKDGCPGISFPTKGKIAVGVVIGVVGLVILGLITYWVWLVVISK